jgi:hypothetical protein
LQTTASLELFRFNRQTRNRPASVLSICSCSPQRATRPGAVTTMRCAAAAFTRCRSFGDGALPFDVVIPGRGRGTLRLHDGSLYIETEEPITLCTGCDCGSIGELAMCSKPNSAPTWRWSAKPSR